MSSVRILPTNERIWTASLQFIWAIKNVSRLRQSPGPDAVGRGLLRASAYGKVAGRAPHADSHSTGFHLEPDAIVFQRRNSATFHRRKHADWRYINSEIAAVSIDIFHQFSINIHSAKVDNFFLLKATRSNNLRQFFRVSVCTLWCPAATIDEKFFCLFKRPTQSIRSRVSPKMMIIP